MFQAKIAKTACHADSETGRSLASSGLVAHLTAAAGGVTGHGPEPRKRMDLMNLMSVFACVPFLRCDGNPLRGDGTRDEVLPCVPQVIHKGSKD